MSNLSFLQGIIPNPGIELRSSTLQVDSLLAEPPGKPQNTERVAIPSPVDLPDPGIEPGSLALQAHSLSAEITGHRYVNSCLCIANSTFAIWNSEKFFQILSILIWLYPWVRNLWVRKACTAVPQLLRA